MQRIHMALLGGISMICERCHKNEATVHTVQIINGEKIEHYYCQNCANETGIDNSRIYSRVCLISVCQSKAK